jgi:type VI secretion system ImpM family protein
MNDVVYGYYGKLPVSPEFLRLHASGPELRWLDEWLQQGILYAKTQEGAAWAERIAQASSYGFFYMPNHEGRVVYGAIMASHDKAGRSFPFLSYAFVERNGFALQPWLIPVAAADFIHDRTLATRRLQRDLDWEAFRRAVEDQMVQQPDLARARETFNQFTQSTTVRQWWEADAPCLGEATRPEVDELLTRVAQVRYPDQKGIRIPIGREGIPGNFDLAFWLQLYLEQQEGTAHSHVGLFCFWRREPSHGTALLSIGPGSPNSVRLLVNPEAQDDAWWDVTTTMPDQVRAKAVGATQPPTIDLEDSLMTVAQLMRHHKERTDTTVERVGVASTRRDRSTLAML